MMKLELNNKLHLHGAPAELAAQFCAQFTLDNPLSTTTATSGTVNEVCAIALEKITLVEEAAAGSRRTFLCSSKLTLL